MASAQVVETSVHTNNSPSQDYTANPDDHSNHSIDSPGFKPFTVIKSLLKSSVITYIAIIWHILCPIPHPLPVVSTTSCLIYSPQNKYFIIDYSRKAIKAPFVLRKPTKGYQGSISNPESTRKNSTRTDTRASLQSSVSSHRVQTCVRLCAVTAVCHRTASKRSFTNKTVFQVQSSK